MLIDREPDGLPDRIGEFLHGLLIRRRALHVYVLTWDFHMIYWQEREWWLPSKLAANRRLHFVKDATHPVGASHHQKIIVIDDAVAFVGGLDFAQCRWDTSAHVPRHPERAHFGDGKPCRPFHDVQMMVDGNAAMALGELARDRWKRATGRSIPPSGPADDLWPATTEPHLTHVQVGISRTLPEYAGRRPVAEIQSLFLDSLKAARKHVYIETQYLTSKVIADLMAERLQDPKGPEIVLVLHPHSDGWLEQHTMDVLRGRVLYNLREADRFHRLGLYYPRIPDSRGQCISMHSKVCIVDNELVRVGSANLSNRSMGFDSECDLAIEAGGNPHIQARIAWFRHILLAEHLGVGPERVADEFAKDGLLIGTIGRLRSHGRSLEIFKEQISSDIDEVVPDARFIDPSSPYEVQLFPRRQRQSVRRQVLVGGLGLLMFLVLAGLWQWSPAREYLDVTAMAAYLEESTKGPAAVLITIGGFLIGGILVVPVMVLIAMTVLAFGPWWGFLYAFTGMTLSALLTFGIGRVLGHNLVDRVAGSRVYHVSRALASKGILAVVTIRLLPVAPFSVINAIAGATHIRTKDFLIGTMIGELPGLLGVALFVDQFTEAVRHPGAGSIGLVLAIAALLAAGALGIRRWLRGTSPESFAQSRSK
jgi:uncharacterized membrane protein YdjX (TVP38/TMEM64 family)/phosphatidylserine/phosphatidylglycerophosphate/cardiolipin synthase-like enzyme